MPKIEDDFQAWLSSKGEPRTAKICFVETKWFVRIYLDELQISSGMGATLHQAICEVMKGVD